MIQALLVVALSMISVLLYLALLSDLFGFVAQYSKSRMFFFIELVVKTRTFCWKPYQIPGLLSGTAFFSVLAQLEAEIALGGFITFQLLFDGTQGNWWGEEGGGREREREREGGEGCGGGGGRIQYTNILFIIIGFNSLCISSYSRRSKPLGNEGILLCNIPTQTPEKDLSDDL